VSDIAGLLDFWFGAPGSPGYGERRKVWFEKDAAFDAAIRERFLTLYEAAAAGALEAWHETPEGCLALCLLLDQVPRNLFRNDPRAFATDAAARDVARYALDRGFDQALLPVQRCFFYLPFEHSEDLADQDRCVALFAALPEADWKPRTVDYAERHRDVIRRYGRFPHRNAALGRQSTTAEQDYLAQPDAGF
jgi:uncharacterized protein (DUF924 family)